jgi:methylenetetrahydrofolate dehydrogenase (NADP+)/methenyltetrahydrofolate cyclohydrolase
MTAQILDGNALAKQLRITLHARVQHLINAGHTPSLAVVLIGDNPASQVYVRNKIKACEEVGMRSVLHQYPADITAEALFSLINQLNQDKNVDGILVQLPLPAHLDSHQVIETIAADKDVDGFHVQNAGLLMTGTPLFRPCTPYGVMKMLEAAHIPLKGAHAVIVGASNIVGKPQAMLLLQAGATVTLCNSKTRDLASHTRMADIVVMAVGRPNMLTGDMIKAGAVVIDVGINRLPDGKLCGDVEFASVAPIAGHISPVPGGVGPMTITMLLMNTVEAVERRHA